MGPLRSRAYRPADFFRISELLLAGREAGTVEAYPSVSELRLLLANPDAVEARVWSEAPARPVAFALFEPTWRSLTFFAAPGAALDIASAVLA
jgi:hypothetical protein